MTGMIIASSVFCVLIVVMVVWMRRTTRRKYRTMIKDLLRPKRRVRIAYVSKNAILLCPKGEDAARRGDNLDLPFDTVLQRHETVEHGLARMLCPFYPESLPDVRFCLKHRSRICDHEYETYLFLVWCGRMDIPQAVSLNNKLWTRRQIEANLGHGVFTPAFEEEYPHLRLVVDTWNMVERESE